jgi:hypothetical protein
MANENDNQGGFEGKQGEFDKEKKTETGQQQPIGGQQGQAETKIADPTGQQGTIAEPGAGQQGAAGGFVGSQGEETGEYLQDDKTKQAGFAEQGQGAADETESGDIERGGERGANRSTDVEGSSGA